MSITRTARGFFIVLLLVAVLSLPACGTPQASIVVNDTAELVHISAREADQRLIELADVMLKSADEVILAEDPNDRAVLKKAREVRLPVLPETDESSALLTRLGATAATANSKAGPETSSASPTLVLFGTEPTAAEVHLVHIAGGVTLHTTEDPRTDRESLEAIANHDRVIVIGAPRYSAEVVYNRATVAGGKYLLFDDQHFIALYGHPSGPALGLLGEQGPKKSTRRIERLVNKYEAVAPGVTFQPAFEVITTVASSSPGKRKDYSGRTPISTLRPLIDEAKAEGITVILDLQPGRSSILEQAKSYEELLREPHVGLAIDPEWKLGKKGKPLQRIGHVSARQVNEVSAWLAELTRENVLPQKMFVLHQFQTQMIRGRDHVRTNHPELATVIHVDGQGPPAAKHNTWRHIRQDAPPNVEWGWKNFIDEDAPMLTPKKTWKQVRPHPGLITYQ